jgi:hypothetical protein
MSDLNFDGAFIDINFKSLDNQQIRKLSDECT